MKLIFLVLILWVFVEQSYGQIGTLPVTSCFSSQDIDTSALKEKFLEEMERNVLTEADYYRLKDSIDKVVSKKIIVPDSIAPELFLALIYFPEIADKEIVVKYRSIRGTMNARPVLANLFRKKSERKYILLINNNQGRYKGLELESITFNARVGWFGHEFAHLYTYQHMSNLGTLIFTVKYLFSNEFIRKVERYTNVVAIKKGLTFQIYQGEQFILMYRSMSDDYRKSTIYRALTYSEYICFWNLYRNP